MTLPFKTSGKILLASIMDWTDFKVTNRRIPSGLANGVQITTEPPKVNTQEKVIDKIRLKVTVMSTLVGTFCSTSRQNKDTFYLEILI